MSESASSQPTTKIKRGLARLLVGIDTDTFDNGTPEPWRTIGQRLRGASIGERPTLLEAAVADYGGIDFHDLKRDLAVIDPTNDEDPAEEPADGPAALPPAVPFPLDALSRSLGDYVREGAEAIGCPPDYIAIPLLASVSAAIGTTVRLQIKSEWYEWASLYTAVVAPSGAKKTPALQFALRFANDKSIEFDLEHQRNLETHDRRMAEYRLAVETRKHSKDKSGLPDLPDKPTRPAMKRATIADTTVEALGKRLKETPRGLLMVRDEMAGWLLGMNQYKGGRGNDLQFFLSIWSGVQTTIDRKQDDDPVVLHQPFLSITGGIQPGVLPRILGRERLDDGCTARILFADPRPLQHRPSEAAVRDETIVRAQRMFEALYCICHREPYTTPPTPHLVRLARDARRLFMTWEERIGRHIDTLSDDDSLRAPLSKMPGYVGRLALLLHVAKWTERGTETFGDINEQTMSEAIQLADYFVAHAERVWCRLVESPEDTQMRQLQSWMEKRRHPVSAREILQSGAAGLRRSLEVRSVIDRMAECGRVYRIPTGRTERYALTSEDGTDK